MKKILSLMLVAMMLVSIIPNVFAAELPGGMLEECPICGVGVLTCPACSGLKNYCPNCGCESCGYGKKAEIPEVGKTTVTLVGTEEAAGAYYEVEVPAAMTPGDSADVTVKGNWSSTQTLKVTAPEKVTLYNGNQSIDIAITFAGINAAGNDLANCSATADLQLADASVKFGTWTGVIEYNVELVNGTVTPTPDPEQPSDPDDNTNNTINFQFFEPLVANEGMTWREWIESEYNTNVKVGSGVRTELIIRNDGTIGTADEQMLKSTVPVKPTDVIENGGIYISRTYADQPAEANLITFTIDDTSYQAEEYMPYGEWVNSEYNTDGFLIAHIKHSSTGNEMDAIVSADKTKYLYDMSPVKLNTPINKYDAPTLKEFGSSGSWWDLVEPGENQFVFTIDGKEYQAEYDSENDKWMRWSAWLESDYNIDGYYAQGNSIYNSDGIAISGLTASAASMAYTGVEVIKPNAVYYLVVQ